MINKKSLVPIYYQLKVDIQEKIKQEIYKVGEQLPTDMEFCEIYGVSRITVRRALSELESEGYIDRQQGKGSYVRLKEIKQNISKFYSFTDETIKMGFIPSAIFLKMEIIFPNEEIKEKLKLDDNDKVILIERLRLANELIAAYDRSYIPEKLIPGFNKTMLIGGSLYQALEQNFGFRPNNSEETIEAIAINKDDAEKMRLEEGTPQLLVKRVSYLDDKRIEYNYRIVNSKVYKYRLKLDK